MFRPDEIQARLHEQPFRPLRLIASEGLRYDIMHPGLVLVGQSDLAIGFPSTGNPHLYDRPIRVAIAHIVGIEDLPVTTSAGSNGSAT